MSREMKNSGIPWIGEIPEGWEVAKIKQLFSLYAGATPKSDVNSYWDGDIKWITPADFKTEDVYVNQGKRNITKEGLDSCGTNMIRPNSIVFSKRAPIGLVAINTEPLCTNQGCISCVPKSSSLSKYYYYVMSVFTDTFEVFGSGTTFKELSAKSFGNFLMPFPPLSEQQAIASYLDEKCADIDELVSLQEEMIKELEAYKQSIITEAVTKGLDPNVPMKDSGVEWIGEIPKTWEVKNLTKIIWLRARLGWKGLKAEEYVDYGYPFLSAFNIVNNTLDWTELNFINKQRFDESPEIQLSIGDVLIVKDGAGIGKVAMVDCLPQGESTVNSSLGVITPTEVLCYQFLYYFLLSNPFQNMVGFLKNGMGVPHLTQENMRSVLIPLPPMDEQMAIVSSLNDKCADIDNLVSLRKQKIEELKEYKKSVIFEVVTGKIKVD